MIIKEAKFFPFSLKFKTPFYNSNFSLDKREGFIVILKDESGNLSYGECTPLFEFTNEKMNEVEKELVSFINNISSKEINDNFEFVNPSVAFCIEQAINGLKIQNDNDYKLNFVNNKNLQVNALVNLVEKEQAIEIISKKIRDGFTTFKLKVGRDNPYEDYLLVEKIRELFGFNICLRLDANRKWNSDEAIEYLNNLEKFKIDYVEEPCDTIIGTLRTCENTSIPLALDESLKDYETSLQFVEKSSFKYFVIKPMVIGFNASLKLITAANRLGKYVIVSSSFQSAIGKSGLVFLAAQTNHNFAHGLDTSDFFENYIMNDFYKIKNAIISFDINNFPPAFEFIDEK